MHRQRWKVQKGKRTGRNRGGREGGREGGRYFAEVGEGMMIQEGVGDQQLDKAAEKDVKGSAPEA